LFKVLTSDFANNVLSSIHASSSSIDVLAYVVNFNLYKRSDRANLIYVALKDFVRAGNVVRFILDYPKLRKSNYHCNKFCARRFLEAGFSVRYLESGSTQHSKVIIFDCNSAMTGSHNLTTRSVINPFDISILSDLPYLVTFLSNYFNSLWEKSFSV